jgi:hypothetical protein
MMASVSVDRRRRKAQTMTRTAMLGVALLVASPAFAQSRVYTNADLGKPLSTDRPTVSDEELRALAERQFTPALDYPSAPHVLILRGAPEDGPWDWPRDAVDQAEPDGLPLWLAGYGGGRHRQAERPSRRGGAAAGQRSTRQHTTRPRR